MSVVLRLVRTVCESCQQRPASAVVAVGGERFRVCDGCAPARIRVVDRVNAWLDRRIASEVGGDVYPPTPEADR